MVTRHIDWASPPKIEEHSKIKLIILRQYFRDYLRVRCADPRQEKFRLAIIDGFSGGGRYGCGTSGSPLVFLEVLDLMAVELNMYRANNGMKPITLDCQFIACDTDRIAIETLGEHIYKLKQERLSEQKFLNIQIDLRNCDFALEYLNIKNNLKNRKISNTIFVLDQYGYASVSIPMLKEILSEFKNAEIFLNFPARALQSFLPGRGKFEAKAHNYEKLGFDSEEISKILAKGDTIPNGRLLGEVENFLFSTFKDVAEYVSPFAIHEPGKWGYWWMHFANRVKARQVYNAVLHENSNHQVHYGRSGLQMLGNKSTLEQNDLYLFSNSCRENSKSELVEDVARLVASQNRQVKVSDFNKLAFKETPAHGDDISHAIFDNPELVVLTKTGSARRTPQNLRPDDTIILKDQKSFYPASIFPVRKKPS